MMKAHIIGKPAFIEIFHRVSCECGHHAAYCTMSTMQD